MTITREQAEELAKNIVRKEKLFSDPRVIMFEEDEKNMVIDLSPGLSEKKGFAIRVKIDRSSRKILNIKKRKISA